MLGNVTKIISKASSNIRVLAMIQKKNHQTLVSFPFQVDEYIKKRYNFFK
jgi:hypothetical protein